MLQVLLKEIHPSQWVISTLLRQTRVFADALLNLDQTVLENCKGMHAGVL
jgi:hypothetical protein